MIPWELIIIDVNGGGGGGVRTRNSKSICICSTFLNKTVIFFILIYLFICTSTSHCRPIYNDTNQVQQQESLPPSLIFTTTTNNNDNNNNRILNNHNHQYNFQRQNNTNAVIRVIVTKSSSTSVAAAAVRPNRNSNPSDRNNIQTANDDDSNNSKGHADENDPYANLHSEHFPDLSRLFSSVRTTASTITQSSSLRQEKPTWEQHRTPIFQHGDSSPTSTTPRATTYHPDFFFTPFYSNMNRMHAKRKIENRSISQNYATAGENIADYQHHPDNIFSVFYHAFSQQGSPSGSFSFHSQSQQHHHLRSPPTAAELKSDTKLEKFQDEIPEPSPTPAMNQRPHLFPYQHHQHEVFSISDGNVENFRLEQAGTNPVPITTNLSEAKQNPTDDSHIVSVVSETRSLTAASTVATLSAQTHSISSASTSTSSSGGADDRSQYEIPEFKQEPISAPLVNNPQELPSLGIYSNPNLNSDNEETSTISFRGHRIRQTKRLRKSHASQLPLADHMLATFTMVDHEPKAQPTIQSQMISDPKNYHPQHSLFSMPTEIPPMRSKIVEAPSHPESLVQWEQPEQVWGRPEMVWGQAERNWEEPEQNWGPSPNSKLTTFGWPAETIAKMSQQAQVHIQHFQSNSPLSVSTSGGPKIYEIASKVSHNSPKTVVSPTETVTLPSRRKDERARKLMQEDDEDEANSNHAKFYEIGEDEEDEPKELNLDENTMNSTIENAQLAARSWELPELAPSSSLMSPLHHTSSTFSSSSSVSSTGAEMAAESIQISHNVKNGNSNNELVNNYKTKTTANSNPNLMSDNGKSRSSSSSSSSTQEDESADVVNNFESQKTTLISKSDSYNASNNDHNNSSSSSSSSNSERPSKKFGYVLDGSDVRKYRVEERTPDGYIVGEYGVINHDNGFLRGVRYTADGTINPRLIHQALMKFLSL